MDLDRLDRLARSVAAARPRRRVLGLLASIPVAGGLLGLSGPEEGDGKKRRRRGQGKHEKRDRHQVASEKRRRKKKCKPKPASTVCAGKCGAVTNNCKKLIDCGACTCPRPCQPCFTCDSTTRTCVPDATQAGKPCGSGQVCVADGTCACTASSCPACQQCGGDGTCGGCDGCCDRAGVCQAGDSNSACGGGGETCVVCAGQDACVGGGCVCQSWDCTAQGKTCGPLTDGCGNTLNCGTCANPIPICTNNVCEACRSDTQCGPGQVCCNGECFSGVCCAATQCTGPGAPNCVEHACTCAGNDNAPCPGNKTCCSGGCADLLTDRASCGTCGHACSGSTPVCWGGACVCGDVCADGCRYTSVQAAINAAAAGSIVRICPGTYGAAVIDRNITLVSAGSGEVILDGNASEPTVTVQAGVTAALAFLTITNGRASYGAGVRNAGTLNLQTCLVTRNTADITGNPLSGLGGGVWNGASGSLTLDETPVNLNWASNLGGGIANAGTLLLRRSNITENFANNGGGGLVNLNGASATLSITTVGGNTSGSSPAGIRNDAGGTLNLMNGVTISGNTPGNCSNGGVVTGASCPP